MSPPVVLPQSRLVNKIIGWTTGGVKFQIFLASVKPTVADKAPDDQHSIERCVFAKARDIF